MLNRDCREGDDIGREIGVSDAPRSGGRQTARCGVDGGAAGRAVNQNQIDATIVTESQAAVGIGSAAASRGVR